uniref:MFS transporter n=1 Tax=Schlesneria paludicola TaxID=360056 RepID=A0A7C4QSI2_9PLAN
MSHLPTSRPLPDQPESASPTRTRYVVLLVLCLLAGILYLDRICIAAALDSIERDLHLTHTQSGYVLMAFTLAYGLFEVPTGRWGDRLGARRVLTRISLWWSAFTALTGACHHLWSLLTVRFLFGAGEAGAFPNVARVLSRWFPDSERGRAQGVLLAASQVGGALAPFLAALLIQQIGWRWTFVVFGSIGGVWAAGFWWWFRDDPAAHPAVNAAEAAEIGRRAASDNVHAPIPWNLVLRNASIWCLGTIMTLASFNSYIYFSWFPKYLKAARNVGDLEAGLMASTVLALAALGTFLGGYLYDRLVLPAGLKGRRLMGGSAFFAAAMLLGCALLSHDPWTAAGLTALSCFCTQSTQPLWWSCSIGISGRHVGALFGLMNSMGVVGAMGSQFLVGALADWFGEHGYSGRAQWDPIFHINLGVLCLAGLLWSGFRFVTVEPVPGEGAWCETERGDLEQ